MGVSRIPTVYLRTKMGDTQDAAPKEGLSVYVFDGESYTGFEGTTDASGEVSLILPDGDYRFRADLNGTQFWSGAANHCTVPSCEAASVTVTKPVTVSVISQVGTAYPDLNVYAFDGESYTGFNGVSDAGGEVVFTLPEGDYRFRADLNDVQFWSGEIDHCALPGCEVALVEIPGAFGVTEITIDYTYDPLYRLTAADYDDDDGTFFHYTYDAVGNRLTQDTLAGTNAYAYDIANRLTSVDGTSYTWDNNGNLLTDGASTYTYNYANMLANVNQGGVVYEYLYSGLGDRLQQTIDGVPTSYTLDINTGLTQVLADGTNTYLYGQGRIAQEGVMTEYFLSDAMSSVRQLVDGTVEVTLTQSYEPYGNLLGSEGEGKSIFQFTGEIQNHYSGLVYLRSRYYMSDSASFITKDVWNGNQIIPMSFNNWRYVNGNPVNYSDPFGYYSKDQIMSLLGVYSWEEILELFEIGGKYEGKWGWLGILRNAESGDELFFHDKRLTITSTTSDYSSSVMFSGRIYAVGGNIYVQSESGYFEFHDVLDYASTLGTKSMTLASDGTSDTKVLYRYYENEKVYHWNFDPEKVDKVGLWLDVAGIATDVVSFGTTGRLINGFEVVNALKTSIGLTDLYYGGWSSIRSYLEDNCLTPFEIAGLGTDVLGVPYPIWPDILGIVINLSGATTISP